MIGAIIVVVGAVVTVWTIVVSIVWIVRPGETEPNHPKRVILREDR